MPTPVEVPKLGNTVEECLIARWAKHEGDSVSAGDLVAEIETDKATFEVTAPVDGTILDTFFDEGAFVPVFTNLFVIGNPGESVEPYRPQGNAQSVAPAAGGDRCSCLRRPSPHRRHPRCFIERQLQPPRPPLRRRTRLSSRVRRLRPRRQGARRGSARAVFGESPRLRPRRRDAGGAGRRARPAAADARRAQSNIREKIARRMRESLSATAQYTLNASADAAGLLALRARIKASNGVPQSTSTTWSCSAPSALWWRCPNSMPSSIDGQIPPHGEMHLGFACDTPRGLLVPVIRNAHRLAVAELARRAKELAAAVRGTISPDESLRRHLHGQQPGRLRDRIVHPAAESAAGRDPWRGGHSDETGPPAGRVEFIDAIGLSLTCDHQAIDGAPGARFLQVLQR